MIPIYVTRPNSDGETGTLWLSAWMGIVMLLTVWLNVMVWGLIGLYTAGAVVL